MEDTEYITTGCLGKKINIDYLNRTIDEWEIKEIPPTKENLTRTVILTREEKWRFEDE
jgi:hypothetical protein